MDAEDKTRAYGPFGLKYEVDHIVPIKGRNVCGLHVPWNLRAIPKEQNREKNNRLDEALAIWAVKRPTQYSKMTDEQLLEIINKTPEPDRLADVGYRQQSDLLCSEQDPSA